MHTCKHKWHKVISCNCCCFGIPCYLVVVIIVSINKRSEEQSRLTRITCNNSCFAVLVSENLEHSLESCFKSACGDVFHVDFRK